MRTRRSPANQDRLFRELFRSKLPGPTPIQSFRCWDCRNYPKGGRNTGRCTLMGMTVMGVKIRSCFEARTKARKA